MIYDILDFLEELFWKVRAYYRKRKKKYSYKYFYFYNFNLCRKFNLFSKR